MRDIAITALYWLLNACIVLAAIFYAFQLWGERHRLLYGVILLAGGMVWHIGRGAYAYRNGMCEGLLADDGFLSVTNKCIPAMAYDIIWAQIGIFVGMFVLLAALFKRVNQHES